MWEKNLDLGISGHIDLLQVRRGRIYILDFKPGAARENEQKVASQLFLYASGLSFRTGIALNVFRCAWFDGLVYFEFDPSKTKVKFPGSKWRSSSKGFKSVIREGKTPGFGKHKVPDSEQKSP